MIAQNRTFGRPGTYALRASRTSCAIGSPIDSRIALQGDIRSARTLGAGLYTSGTIPAADGGGGAGGPPDGRVVPGGARPPTPAGARTLTNLVPEPLPGEIDLSDPAGLSRVSRHAVRRCDPRRTDRGSLRRTPAPSGVRGPCQTPDRCRGSHARGRLGVRGCGLPDDGVWKRGGDRARRVQPRRSPPSQRSAERSPRLSLGGVRAGDPARITGRAPARPGLRGDYGGLAPFPEDGAPRLHCRGPVPPGVPGVLVLPREDRGADRGVRDILSRVSGARGGHGHHAPEDGRPERNDGSLTDSSVPDPCDERGASCVPRDRPLRSLRGSPRDHRDRPHAGRVPTPQRAVPDADGALLQGQARDRLGAEVRGVPPAPEPTRDARSVPGPVARRGRGES